MEKTLTKSSKVSTKKHHKHLLSANDTQKSKPFFKKHYRFVCKVCSPELKNNQRKQLIEKASDSEIFSLCECISNIVSKNCPITKEAKKKILKFKRPLLNLCKPKSKLEVGKRKKILSQSGSGVFLPIVASAVLSYLLNK